MPQVVFFSKNENKINLIFSPTIPDNFTGEVGLIESECLKYENQLDKNYIIDVIQHRVRKDISNIQYTYLNSNQKGLLIFN